MANAKKETVNLSRRNLLKYAVPVLLAGAVAPSLFRTASAKADVVSVADVLADRKPLVVDYSHTGHTNTMAHDIHNQVGGDMVQLQTVTPYPADHQKLMKYAWNELKTGVKPALSTKVDNMDSYDVIFLGSPCWWGTIATPVISFLSEYDFSGKTIVPFMTHLGSGLGRSRSHIKTLCPGADVLNGLAIRGDVIDLAKGYKIDWTHGDVKSWLRGLRMA